MKDGRHIIWSNDIDYDDWREDLEEQYPDLTEAERMELMYELNSDYLDDERSNLDIQLSRPILVVGDLGLWNGRRMGYNFISCPYIFPIQFIFALLNRNKFILKRLFRKTNLKIICRICISRRIFKGFTFILQRIVDIFPFSVFQIMNRLGIYDCLNAMIT